MAGPSAAGEALRWAREALGGGQRGITAADMKSSIKKATGCEAHAGGIPRFGGTCWRVTGPSLDEIATAIGVEVYVDHLGKRLIVVTVF